MSNSKALKSSVKTLQKQGPVIATKMYDNFFTEHPELKDYFSICFLGKSASEDGSEQITLMAKVMAHILFQFILNLDKADSFKTDLDRIAAKHASRSIKPEYFPYLGDALLKAVKETLGDKAEDDILKAWRIGYDTMAEELIKSQKKIESGMHWMGLKAFKVDKWVEELVHLGLSSSSDDDDEEPVEQKTTKVYLSPKDGSALPHFTPGQYVCCKFILPGTGVTHRNYVLVGKSDDPYWVLDLRHDGSGSIISEFCRKGLADGSIDTFEVSAPTGTFLLLESLST